jgi:phage shock protein C
MQKRIYKSRKDKIIDGVCGGLARYLEIDPVLVRLLWALLIFLGGTGIILYIIAMIIMPREPLEEASSETRSSAVSEGSNSDERIDSRTRVVIAAALIFFGIAFLLSTFTTLFIFSGAFWKVFVGVVLIAGGGYIVFRSFGRK